MSLNLTMEFNMFLILSISITIIVYILDKIFSKKTRSPYVYLSMFLILTIVNFFFFDKADASEASKFNFEYPIDYIPDAKTEISYLSILRAYKLSPKDRKYYEDKVRFHKSNAERTFRDAKNKCWYLPDIDDRDKAKYCFNTGMAAVFAGDPYSKAIAAVASLLLQYGLDCMDEWEYIQNKLHWSQYHYEMMEFYQDVLENG